MKPYICLLSSLCLLGSVHALNIELDFSKDTTTFFENAGAREALQAAANDLGRVINTRLNAVTANNFDAVIGGNQSANWDLFYTNPTTNANERLDNIALAADTVRVYIGSQALGFGDANGIILGQGSAGAASVAITNTGGTVDQAAHRTASNTFMNRGGPINRVFTTNGGTYEYGFTVGSLLFNSSLTNTTPIFGFELFHFDHTTAPGANQVDFYTVALHELIHAIGFGGAENWESHQVNSNGQRDDQGTVWTGAFGVAENGGSGTDLATFGHVGPNTVSTAAEGSSASGVVVGGQQVALMDPTAAQGERRYMTNMDLAFLKDMGWSVVPEPSVAVLALAGSLFGLRRRR